MFRLTYSACTKPDGLATPDQMVTIGSKKHYFCGDFFYNDGSGLDLNGTTITTDILNGASDTVDDIYKRYNNVYGRKGSRSWAAFWDAVDAGKIEVGFMPDDHDGKWNNNDWSVTAFNGAWVFPATRFDNAVAATAADILPKAQRGEQALKKIIDNYGTTSAGVVMQQWTEYADIPPSMVSVMNSTSLWKKYWYDDFDAAGNKIYSTAAPNLFSSQPASICIRVIVPDCMSSKHTAATTDNASKSMLGATQKVWFKAQIADAVARGAQHIVIMCTKDLLNLDNGDGWCAYTTERDELLSYIDTNNYPVIWVTGDRHNPHAYIARKTSGDLYDAAGICACPFGQGTGGLTQYKQNIFSWTQNDAGAYGLVEVDDQLRTTTLSIVDMWSHRPLCTMTFAWGARMPSVVTTAAQHNFQPNPAPFRAAPAYPGNNVAYTNTANYPVQLVISGGTITLIEFSRDGGTTYDSLGETAGAWMMLPGDKIRCQSSVNPTKFVVLPFNWKG